MGIFTYISFILIPIYISNTITTYAFAHTIPNNSIRDRSKLNDEQFTSLYDKFGINYFTFFDGPGLIPESLTFTPNVLGKPSDDGLRLSNFVSVSYKLNPVFAIDFQARIQLILNNSHQIDKFQNFRWQSPRIGISGKLLSGDNWNLTGAFNTDFPYFFPQPFGGGLTAKQRTTLFTPGLFAKLQYEPHQSRWSIVSLVMPRFFIYSDRSVAEAQLSRAGFSPELKNEFIFDVAPTLNFALTRLLGLRLGTEFIYSKLILSNWNPLQISLNVSDVNSNNWRFAPIPLQFGITYEWRKELNTSFFIQGFPIAAQRIRNDGYQAAFIETTSIGMWLSGKIL